MSIAIENKLTQSNIFWLKKRLIFTIIVGIAGIISISRFWNLITAFDILGIILWGIVANAMYSFGYVLESLIIHKTNGQSDLKKSRVWLFWIGTICYTLLTILYTPLYYYQLLSPD